jgi:hypothetical protein
MTKIPNAESGKILAILNLVLWICFVLRISNLEAPNTE